ncbi:hypothetical protein [Desulfitobacterium hafniense]|uniref:hypothetical protein n=1 Tax=Desulfitobacterium hafniense TaxID=49338 RepID=UPI0003688678|nr:hypothetical protein [Desulfitobacterium hafniense]
MALLNYTTTIGVHKTLGEIQQKLVDHGARKLMFDYDDKARIESISFMVMTPEGERGVRLPANIPAIYEVLKQQKRAGKIKTNPDYAQAERVAWRIIKDWVEAQMAIIETQMVQFEEVFLPYMLNHRGQTFFEAYKLKQLDAGESQMEIKGEVIDL